MKTIHFLPVILLSAGLILFYSCSDNVVNSGNTSADVNGTVLDQDGHAVYPVRVWLNHESYKDVNPDGTFSFSNVQFPYNITAVQLSSNKFTSFEGLTVSNPKLYPDLSYSIYYQYQAIVFMTFPPISPNGRTETNFISKEKDYVSSQTAYLDSSSAFRISWNGNSSISGKMVIIQYRRDNNGNVIAYDRFGFRDTSISSGETIYVRMQGSELQYNPPENNLTFTMPAGVQLNNLNLGILFDGYGGYSHIFLLGIQGYSIPLTYVVPGNLSLDYHMYAYLAYGYNSYYALTGHGGFVYVPSYSPVNLLRPADNDSADYNTEFYYSGNGKVHVTKFYASTNYSNYEFSIVSDNDSVRLPLLPFFGIILPAGTQFTWSVRRYNDFANVNEFVSDKRNSILRFNTTWSGSRYFYLK